MEISMTDKEYQLLIRLSHAAGLLYVHGLVTDKQRQTIHAKLMKRKVKAEGTKK